MLERIFPFLKKKDRKIAELEAELSELGSKVARLEKEKTGLQTETGVLTSEKSNLTRDFQDRAREIEKLNSRIEALNKELRDVRGKQQAYKEVVQSLQSEERILESLVRRIVLYPSLIARQFKPVFGNKFVKMTQQDRELDWHQTMMKKEGITTRAIFGLRLIFIKLNIIRELSQQLMKLLGKEFKLNQNSIEAMKWFERNICKELKIEDDVIAIRNKLIGEAHGYWNEDLYSYSGSAYGYYTPYEQLVAIRFPKECVAALEREEATLEEKSKISLQSEYMLLQLLSNCRALVKLVNDRNISGNPDYGIYEQFKELEPRRKEIVKYCTELLVFVYKSLKQNRKWFDLYSGRFRELFRNIEEEFSQFLMDEIHFVDELKREREEKKEKILVLKQPSTFSL